MNDNTVGLFNTSNAQWYIDNGNGKWDSCISGAPTTTQDQCLGAWGFGTDTPVTGDWDGNGSITIGVYRRKHDWLCSWKPMLSVAQYQLRRSSKRYFQYRPSLVGYRPVVRNWPGSRAGTKVGIFRPSTGEWVLDNGNWLFNGCGLSDPCFTTPGSQAGDIPFAGDWFGTGQIGAAYFRPSNGTFYFNGSSPNRVGKKVELRGRKVALDQCLRSVAVWKNVACLRHAYTATTDRYISVRGVSPECDRAGSLR